MEWASSFDLRFTIAVLLFIITIVAKYLGELKLNKIQVPVWSVPFAILLTYCVGAGFISFIALFFLLLLLMSSYGVQRANSLWIKSVSGTFAVLTLLALGFHLIPGFNNQLFIDAQVLKGNSIPQTAYINFDKSIGGLIFFLVLLPKSILPNTTTTPGIKTLGLACGILLLTTAIMLPMGVVMGLIEFNMLYYFDYQWVVFFILVQLFSTCLTEEMFFRGFIQHRLYALFDAESRWFNILPLVMTSLLFGLVHFAGGIGYMIAATVAGLGYGLVYQVTQRVEAAIVAHTFLNLMHLLFFTYPLAG